MSTHRPKESASVRHPAIGRRLIVAASALALMFSILSSLAVGVGTAGAATNWTSLTPPAGSGDIADISCPTTSDCYLVGNGISATTNGGATWNSQTLPFGTYGVLSIACPTSLDCYATANYMNLFDEMLVSKDAGTTWTATLSTLQVGPDVVVCPSTNTCYVSSGGDSVYTTTNGGVSWSSLSTPQAFSQITCPSVNDCYAIGASNTPETSSIYATTDGGSNWALQFSSTYVSLADITCASIGVCYATGSEFLATTNEGLTWTQRTAPSADLHSITCISSGSCFGVGNNGNYSGAIVATTDGGYAWTSQSIPNGVDDLNAVVCPATSDCLAVGWNSAQSGGIILQGLFTASVGPTQPNCSSTTTGSPYFSAGYWMTGSNGAVYSCGSAPFYGSLVTLGVTPNEPIVGMSACPDDSGYLLAGADGGIFTFGHVGYSGSMGGHVLNKPIVAIAMTPDCGGYWEVASDGGIFSFGDAHFYGSMGAQPLNEPIVGMAVTPDGLGYRLVGTDGGTFNFGDAHYLGSTGCFPLNKPIVGIADSHDGTSVGSSTACDTPPLPPGGYWMVASDGGVFAFGNAGFFGSMGGQPLNLPIVGIAPTTDDGGYWLAGADGGIFNFGDAPLAGSLPGSGINVLDVVAIVTS